MMIVGNGVGANEVFVEMTFVLRTTGVSEISALAQAERSSNRKRFSILLIRVSRHCEGVV
jgi:hypothetical protein